MQKKLILAITVMLLVLNCCGKNTNTIQVPEEITKGYELADYDIYKLPAKENGKKYEKIYVVGKITEDLFENSKDEICAYLIDDKAQKWCIIIDSNKSSNNYKELLNKDICVCGIYIGSLKKDGSACLNVNKIFNIAINETIVSNYYGNYEGEFDENGKVISNDFDKDDNTIIDFHSIQIQIPYNYIEENLSNEEATYSIYEEDGGFIIKYDKADYKLLIDSYTKYSKYDSLKASFESEGCKLIDSRYYDDIFIYEINYGELKGHMCIKIAEDGMYVISLFSDLSSRFNRENDFKDIIDSIKVLSPSRTPKSYGVNKRVAK